MLLHSILRGGGAVSAGSIHAVESSLLTYTTSLYQPSNRWCRWPPVGLHPSAGPERQGQADGSGAATAHETGPSWIRDLCTCSHHAVARSSVGWQRVSKAVLCDTSVLLT